MGDVEEDYGGDDEYAEEYAEDDTEPYEDYVDDSAEFVDALEEPLEELEDTALSALPPLGAQKAPSLGAQVILSHLVSAMASRWAEWDAARAEGRAAMRRAA
jgi:hypothetical protein